MAIRTSVEEVQKIMPVTIDRTVALSFITTANAMVTDRLGSAGLSDTLLTEIEKFLAAHLLSTTVYRQAESKTVGDASDKYAALGEQFKSTTYGQIVLQLDTSGKMAEAGKIRMVIEAIPSFDDSEVYNL